VAILVTGAAGFIGYHVTQALLARGERVIGVDSLNAYYDVRLKRSRLAQLLQHKAFAFHATDIADRQAMEAVAAACPDVAAIVHLAAQAGVRHSMIDPYAYVSSNIVGQLVLLEIARRLRKLEHFVYASTSSVYGANTQVPFRESERVDTPLSLYAATKRADELMGHAYAHLYGIRQTGLRFFTVYGPWGRPDMAYFGFAEAIMAGTPITLYEGGRLCRDFTYVDDIVAGVVAVVAKPPDGEPPTRLLNIGNSRSESVATLVQLLEASLGRKAILRDAPRPRADVENTWADVSAINELAGYEPAIPLTEGIPRFAQWFLDWRRG
jgi:UDP-glucuronate 4-epimerase